MKKPRRLRLSKETLINLQVASASMAALRTEPFTTDTPTASTCTCVSCLFECQTTLPL